MTFRRLVPALLLTIAVAAVALAIVVGKSTSLFHAPPAGSSEPNGEPAKEIVTKEAKVSVVILPPEEEGRLDALVIAPSHAAVDQGGIFLFVAGAYDAAGRPAKNVSTTWKMNQLGIGDISPGGKFTAGETQGTFEGSIVLVAEQQWHGLTIPRTTSATITILPRQGQALLEQVKVYPQSIQVAPGQILRLYAVGYDANNQPITGLRFGWKVGDALAGKVNESGYFTAGTSPGTYENAVYVEALQKSSKGAINRSSFVTVVVRAPEPGSGRRLVAVNVVPEFISLMPGKQTRLYAVGYDSAGQPVQAMQVIWRLADNTAGTIDDQNLFTASSKPGVHENAILLTGIQRVGESSVLQQAYATVLISPPEDGNLTTLRVFPSRVVALPGSRTGLAAEGIDGHGLIVPNMQRAWEMGEPQAGFVTLDGRFIASNAVGIWPRAIRVTATQETAAGPVRLSVYVDVVIVGRLHSLQLSPSEVLVAQGQSIQLGVVGYDENGIQIPGLDFRWRMLDPAAGTIEPLGLFHARGRPGEYADAIIVKVTQVLK